MFQAKNTTKKFNAWHAEASAKRPMCPEHKGKVIKVEVTAAGGSTEDTMWPPRPVLGL